MSIINNRYRDLCSLDRPTQPFDSSRKSGLTHGYSHESNVLSEVEGYNCFMPYYVYILRTSSNTLYIGQTNNLEKRLKEHKSRTSKSAKYLRLFSSFQLIYKEEYPTRKEAMQREAQLKRWTRSKKEALIQGDKELLKII